MELTDLSYADLRCEPPPGLVEALGGELGRLNLYPPEGYEQLRESIAAYVGVDRNHIVAGNGGDELIDLATRIWGDSVLIPAPTFGQYLEAAARRKSDVCLSRSLHDGIYQVSFDRKALEKATLVWICNPNNPTGTPIPRATIVSVLDAAPGIVVVDECYYEFLGETVVDLIDAYPRLVVLRSFSKSFGLAGLRLGYAISAPENIEQLGAMRQIFSVNRLAERAGCLLPAYADYYDTARRSVASTRDAFVETLTQASLRVFESKTNFVLVELVDAKQLRDVVAALSRESIRASRRKRRNERMSP